MPTVPGPPADGPVWRAHVERDIADLKRVDGEALKRLESMDDTLKELNKTLSDVVTERKAEAKRSKFWEGIKSGALLIIVGIGIHWFGKLALMVQSAKLP